MNNEQPGAHYPSQTECWVPADFLSAEVQRAYRHRPTHPSSAAQSRFPCMTARPLASAPKCFPEAQITAIPEKNKDRDLCEMFGGLGQDTIVGVAESTTSNPSLPPSSFPLSPSAASNRPSHMSTSSEWRQSGKMQKRVSSSDASMDAVRSEKIESSAGSGAEDMDLCTFNMSSLDDRTRVYETMCTSPGMDVERDE